MHARQPRRAQRMGFIHMNQVEAALRDHFSDLRCPAQAPPRPADGVNIDSFLGGAFGKQRAAHCQQLCRMSALVKSLQE